MLPNNKKLSIFELLLKISVDNTNYESKKTRNEC